MTRGRPFGVTLVAVIAWLSGAIQIIDAVIAVLGGAEGRGWIALAIGILTIAVSLGLFRGKNVARVIMAVVFVLNIAVGAWALFVSPYIWIPFFTFLLALIGLVLLFTRRASSFFR